MKRVLCLYIPFLATDRLRKSDSSSATPIATITPHGDTLRIVHADNAARALGVEPDMTLAESKAIVPQLVTYDDDPDADRRQLESLALWAGTLSPFVHIEGNDTLIVDITGCQHLFGGEDNLLDQAIKGLQQRGFTARAAVADTPGAAWAIAHAHPQPAVIAPPGHTVAHLAPLPVWSLRIEQKTTAALRSVGVTTIESLLHLPRSSLPARFSHHLLHRLDQALGNEPEMLTPYRVTPALVSRLDFSAPTDRVNVFHEAIRRALTTFCTQLAKRTSGVCRMFATFSCPDVAIDGHKTITRHATFELNLSKPTRSFDHLRSLLMVLLDNPRLPAPADVLTLWAKDIEPLDDWQEELFVTDSRDAAALGDLLDRMVTRLGSAAVVRPMLLSDHQPECAYRYQSVTDPQTRPPRAAGGSKPGLAGRPRARAKGIKTPHAITSGATGGLPASAVEVPASTGKQAARGTPRGLKPAAQALLGEVLPAAPRPLRLAPYPIEIDTTAVVPEGPPLAFRFQGTRHVVAYRTGPERIETGWWRGPHVQRDYYRVTTDTGLRYWLFRQRNTDRWYLHGWFD